MTTIDVRPARVVLDLVELSSEVIRFSSLLTASLVTNESMNFISVVTVTVDDQAYDARLEGVVGIGSDYVDLVVMQLQDQADGRPAVFDVNTAHFVWATAEGASGEVMLRMPQFVIVQQRPDIKSTTAWRQLLATICRQPG